MNQTWDRFLIGIMSLGYLIAAIFLFGVAIGWTSPLALIQNYLLNAINNWLLGATGIILFLLSLTLFLNVFRSKPVRDAIVHETSLGVIRLTLPALENLVIKSAKSVYGIRDVKTQIKTQLDSVSIHLKVQVLPDLNIPQLTEELQKKVKEYLVKTTGINVDNVKVTVNKITWEAKSRVE